MSEIIQASVFELMLATSKYASENSVYYSGLFKKNKIDLNNFTCLKDFKKIPFLTRQIFVKQAAKLVTTNDAPNYVNCTSGSTYKTKRELPLLHFHDNSEKEVLESLKNSFFKDFSSKPLTLNILSSVHGYSHLHGHKGCFDIPLEKEHHLDCIISILSDKYSFDGFSEDINVLSGTINQLKILTNYCISKGVPSDKFAITTIISAGDWLTPKWEYILSNYWKSNVTNVYGLSELNGFRSSACEYCKDYHSFPTSYVEFLDVNSGLEITDGIAELVVTPLFPVSQYQMLLRYRSNDIVKVNGRCGKSGKVRFTFLGRKDEIIWTSGKTIEPLLTPFEVLKILDDYPEIERISDKRFSQFDFVSDIVNKPDYEIEFQEKNNTCDVTLIVKLKFNPIFYPSQTGLLENNISKAIISNSLFLKKAIESETVNFQIKFC